MFKGDLLECNVDDDLVLLHNRFKNGTNGTCNNGKILGQSFTDDSSSNCYVSQLCMMISPDIVGKTVRCVHDDGTITEVIESLLIVVQTNTATVTTTTRLIGKHTIHVGLIPIHVQNYTHAATSVSVQTVTTVFENTSSISGYTNYKGTHIWYIKLPYTILCPVYAFSYQIIEQWRSYSHCTLLFFFFSGNHDNYNNNIDIRIHIEEKTATSCPNTKQYTHHSK